MNKISALAGLLKYRLSLAVTFSSLTGFLIFDNQPGLKILYLAAGVFLLAGGAAALNQFMERDQDAMMIRTMSRPIPGEKIEPGDALKTAFTLLLSGTVILFFSGIIPALLGLLTVFIYNIVYTRLKKVSWFAVIPGSLVGAIPPLIGFTAAGGKVPTAEIILFASFMFLWQLPHFWLIILRYRSDYQRAGFKTFPGIINERLARIIVFTWVTLTSSFLAFFAINDLLLNRLFSIILILLNIFFILFFYHLLFLSVKERSVKRAFMLINSFSLAIMVLFILNSCLR